MANVALATLLEVMTDKAASPAARVQAARTVLELSGDLGKTRKDGEVERPLSELSAEELTRLIDRWTEERAAMARQLEPGKVAHTGSSIGARRGLQLQQLRPHRIVGSPAVPDGSS